MRLFLDVECSVFLEDPLLVEWCGGTLRRLLDEDEPYNEDESYMNTKRLREKNYHDEENILFVLSKSGCRMEGC